MIDPLDSLADLGTTAANHFARFFFLLFGLLTIAILLQGLARFAYAVRFGRSRLDDLPLPIGPRWAAMTLALMLGAVLGRACATG